MKQAKKRFKELLPGALARLADLRMEATLADSGKTAKVPAFGVTHDAAAETVTVKVLGLEVRQGDHLPEATRKKSH